jgi:formylglycine-generating enzyme required for sulfatase activity
MVVVSGQGVFAIGRYEVTNADFARYCAATGACPPPAGDPNLPVARIQVAQALAYAKWLGDVTGRRYRLPTEAEWEWAATVGGKDPLGEGNCRVMQGDKVIAGGAARSAASGESNEWGLVNTVGNVWEMTQSGGSLVLRGGSFDDEIRNCSPAARRAFGGPEGSVGFRLARELDK